MLDERSRRKIRFAADGTDFPLDEAYKAVITELEDGPAGQSRLYRVIREASWQDEDRILATWIAEGGWQGYCRDVLSEMYDNKVIVLDESGWHVPHTADRQREMAKLFITQTAQKVKNLREISDADQVVLEELFSQALKSLDHQPAPKRVQVVKGTPTIHRAQAMKSGEIQKWGREFLTTHYPNEYTNNELRAWFKRDHDGLEVTNGTMYGVEKVPGIVVRTTNAGAGNRAKTKLYSAPVTWLENGVLGESGT